MRDPRCPWYWQHNGGMMQEPRHRQLRHRSPMTARGLIEGPSGPRKFARAHGEPGNESDFLALAILQDRFMLAIEQIVQILDAHDGYDLAGSLDLLHGNLGESDMPDLALLLRI